MVVDLRLFKNILGVPGEGIHFHVLEIAIVDVLATIIVGWLLAKLLKVRAIWPIIVLFVLGELLHWLFGVSTTFMKLFGL